MKKTILVLLAILVLCSAAEAGVPGRFVQAPDVRDNTIVFTWERDLWSVPATGGVATRLTTHPGMETFAKFSPDGKWIAFTGQYEGADVYLIPATGGTPKRVTFLGTGAQAIAWTPDGKKVLFRSARYSAPAAYTRLFTEFQAADRAP